MAAILEDGKLRLSGYVGDYYFEDGFTASDVVLALAQVDSDSDLTVHVNSGGGIATEGAAIHALLSARPGTTDIVVEGIAASAASLIAMAGDTVTMSAGAVMMIHDPSGFTVGTSADHSKQIEALEALATAYARVYAAKSGKTPNECRTIMKDEQWFTPAQAVEAGFADATTEGVTAAVAAFDYRAYAHAPKRLTALAATKDWRLPDASETARSAVQPGRKEISMTDKDRADALAAELAELKAKPDAATAVATALKADRDRRAAIMALDETKGREALAEHLFTKGDSVEDAKATLSVSAKAEAAPETDIAEFENRRLNGEGLTGGQPAAKAKSGDQPAATAAAIAKMKLLSGKKETA